MTNETDTKLLISTYTEFFTTLNTSSPANTSQGDYQAKINTLSGSILKPNDPLKLPMLFHVLSDVIQSSKILNKDIVSTLLYFNPFSFPTLDHEKFLNLLKVIASKFEMEVPILNFLFSLIITNSYTPESEPIFRRIIHTLSSLNRLKGFKNKINIKIKTLISQAFKVLEDKGDYKLLVIAFVLGFRTRVFPDCFAKEMIEQTISTFNKEKVEFDQSVKLIEFYEGLFCVLASPLLKQYTNTNNYTIYTVNIDNRNSNTFNINKNNKTCLFKEFYSLIEPTDYDAVVVQNIKKKKEKFIHSFIKIMSRDILIYDNKLLNKVFLSLFEIGKYKYSNKDCTDDEVLDVYKEDILYRLYKNVFNDMNNNYNNDNNVITLNNAKKEKKCVRVFVNSSKTGANTTELKKWFKSISILSKLIQQSNNKNIVLKEIEEKIVNSSLYFILNLSEKIKKSTHKSYEVEIIKFKGCLFILVELLSNKKFNSKNYEEVKGKLFGWLKEEKTQKETLDKELFEMIEIFKKEFEKKEGLDIDKSGTMIKEGLLVCTKNYKLEKMLFGILKVKYF